MKHNIVFITIIFLSLLSPNVYSETNKDIEVAKTIAMEACDQGYEGMYLVANVIKNRSEVYNMTPFEVVSAKHQFVGYTHKNRDLRFEECKEESLYFAKNVLYLKDKTNGALFFKRPEEKIQLWHNVLTVQYRDHEFWK